MPNVDPSEGQATRVEVPVLIVGGGPAGLTMALELARRGIRGLLVERRDFTSHFPRAHLLNVRTMETFADVGVAEDVYALSPPEHEWHRAAWYTSLSGERPSQGKRIGYVDAWGGGADLTAYEAASPRKFANVPQIRLDRVLWEHARTVWPDHVRERSELIDLRLEDGAATATIRETATGREYAVDARFVVAADGGRTVADLLGIEVAGPRALLDHVSIYFSANLSQYADEEALLTYFVAPEGQGSFAGALLGLGPSRWGKNCDEWLVGQSFPLSDPALEDDAALVARAKRLIGDDDLDMTVHSISHWQFEGVVAERFRSGPVFLIGDAAHRHPPTGGLGLNTAIGDVSNLAWKLAAVLKGTAGETLLDTYESERQQVAVQNVEHSLRNAGRHAPIAEALGLRRGIGIEEGWDQIDVWASETAEGERRRAAADTAIAANRENFSQLGIEAGFTYERGALLRDDESIPDVGSASEYRPSSRPGHHIPHVWVWRGDKRVSTSDLVEPEGLTLFVDEDARDTWGDAATRASSNLGLRIHVIVIGGARFSDPDGDWKRDRGIQSGGALLVRPDRHVGWRSATLPADPLDALQRAANSILRPRTAPSHTDGLTAGLRRIAEAGERLRTDQRARDARIFTERATR